MILDSSFTAQLLRLTTQLHEQACQLEGLSACGPAVEGNGQINNRVDKDARGLKEAIRDVAFEVYNLCLEPEELLRGYATHAHLLSLHFIQRFEIAKLVPSDIEDSAGTTFEEIATSCAQRPSTVRRMLRHAIGLGVFDETDGRVRHTPVSLLLRQDSYASWMASTCEESWPAATRTVDALERYPEAEEPTESGWSLARMPGMSLYDGIARSSERANRFAKGMEAYSSGRGYDTCHFIETKMDFLNSLPDESCFVDVGGGSGQYSLELRRHFGHLRFVVQDLEGTIQKARQNFEESGLNEPEEQRLVKNRRNGPCFTTPVSPDSDEQVQSPPSELTFTAHDFFLPQPILGAAVYFLRWICHNWSDKYAVKILRHIATAMTADSRLIILDYCIEDDLSNLAPLKRRQMTAMDLGMMQLLNAHERSSSEWKALLAQADPRFEWLGVTKPANSALAIIEADNLFTETGTRGYRIRPRIYRNGSADTIGEMVTSGHQQAGRDQGVTGQMRGGGPRGRKTWY